MTEENTNPTPAAAYVPSPQVRFNKAIADNDLKAAEAALKDGANIDLPLSDGGANVLMKAANESQTNKDESYKLAKWALEHGADPNTIKNSSTPLIRAVESKALPLARLLLDNGADPNFPDMEKARIGSTIGRPAQLPIHRAAF
ncbi:MAG: ankyrin repeat domain-containing protein, partial [Alphaproteobacteria bacterium]|nr:ankyrin repeat domain-containing protein [Alphaproteobacteria bacterium]